MSETKTATAAASPEDRPLRSMLEELLDRNQAVTPEERVIDRKRAIKIEPGRGLKLENYYALEMYAENTFKAGFAPKSFTSAAQVFVAMAMGMELGLTAQQSLRCIAVINGKPGIYGPAALALCQNKPDIFDVKRFREGFDGKDEDYGAFTESARIGGQLTRSTFSLRDAKRAGLWGKPGPWTQYPQRMLMWRARGFNLSDTFADILMGLKTVEELQDTPIEDVLAPGVKVDPEAVEDLRKRARAAMPKRAEQAVVIPNLDVLPPAPAQSPPDVRAAAAAQTPSAASMPDTGEKPPQHKKPDAPDKPAHDPDTVEDIEPANAGEDNPQTFVALSPEQTGIVKKLAGETGLDPADYCRQLGISDLAEVCQSTYTEDCLRLRALALMVKAKDFGPAVAKADIEKDGIAFKDWTEVMLLARIKELEAMPKRGAGRPVGSTGRPRQVMATQGNLLPPDDKKW